MAGTYGMTALEMEYTFNVLFDSIANFSSPGYEHREISLFLTQSQQNIVLDVIDPQEQQRSSATKEELNKISISDLVKTVNNITPLTTGANNFPYGKFVKLPNDFFLPLNETCSIQFNATSYYYNFISKRIRTGVYVRPMKREEYSLSIGSNIRKPNEDVVWRFEYNRGTFNQDFTTNPKQYELVGSSEYNITGYDLTYYRRPENIWIPYGTTSPNNVAKDCELDPYLHQIIVTDAVRLAAATIKDQQKYQTATVETQNQI